MQQKKSVSVFILMLLLTALLTACGGDSAVPQGENSPTSETQPAAQTGETEAPAQAEPVAESGGQTSAPVAAPAEATTVQAAAQLLDLRTLLTPAELETAQGAGDPTVGALTYQTSDVVADVLSLYRTRLAEKGWQELTDQGSEDASYAVRYFRNGAYGLNLSVSDMGGQSMVSVYQSGNINPASLPQMDDAEVSLAAPNTLLYFSAGSVADAADFIQQQLAAQGWRQYSRPNSGSADLPDRRDMSFMQNGVNLTVAVSQSPAQPGKSAVQYSLTLLRQDLPTPAELTGLQLDDSEPYLSYQTSLAPADLTDFYAAEMSALGWQEMADSAYDSPEQTARFFANEAEQLALMLNITPGDGQHTVQLRQFEVEELLALRAGGSADTDTPAGAEPDVETDSEPETVAPPAAAATTFPTPDDAEAVEYDADFGELTFTSASDVETVVDFYRAMLPVDGWQEDEMFSLVTEMLGSIDFSRGDESLSITIMGDVIDSGSSVTVDLSSAASFGGGDMAGEAGTMASAEPLVAEDKDGLPIPGSYTGYSSEGSDYSRRVVVTVPAGVAALSEFFQTELAAQGWSLTASSQEPSSVNLKFEGTAGLLTVAIKANGSESEATLVNKNSAAAEAAGIVPAAGQARIYFGNPSFGDPAAPAFTFTLNGQSIKVAPQEDEGEIGDAPYIELAPGEYSYELSAEGEAPITESITVGADEVWALLAGPFGALPLPIY